MPSRIGPPAETLRAAVVVLSLTGFGGIEVSRLYRSAAMPAGSGPDFVNGVVVARHSPPPEEAMDILHAIEAAFGRVRAARWGPRILDLDLIASGTAILPDLATQRAWADRPPERRMEPPDRLVLPHPRMTERAFVLGPLLDVVPSWRHPVSGRTIRALWNDLPETERLGLTAL